MLLAPASRPVPPPAAPPPPPERPAAARWVRPASLLLLALTALGYIWDLSASGDSNSFYAAAVQAGSKSWKATFFGSLDSSNFITVDKPPASLWAMDLSARIFGFNSWSLLVPEALMGVAAVGLLYLTVKRWFGPVGGLVAGLTLAATPVAALMFRFDNPDALLVLLMTAAAYTLTRAVEKAGTKWVVATGALLGLAFLAKMLQAFTVLPAFGAVYLIAAPTTLRRRIVQLLAGLAGIVVAAGWWVAIVALWPASSRPMIDGSSDNSIINLILGYNGLGRLSGSSGGPGGGGGGGGNFSGATGPLRLFNDLMGGQASWLIPLALVVLVAGLVACGRAARTDRHRAALLLWGGWLVVTGAVFSLGKGVIHTYYTVALAPAIAALVGIGVTLLWDKRDSLVARLLAAASIELTAWWAYELLDRTPSYHPWLRVLVLTTGTAAAVILGASAWLPRAGRRVVLAGLAVGLTACLLAPGAYAVSTIVTPHTGSIPSAGPASSASGFGGGPGGGAGGAGRSAGGPPGQAGQAGQRSFSGGPLGGTSGGPGGSSGSSPTAGMQAGGPGGSGSGGGGSAGGAGGPGGDTTTSAALVKALKAGSYRWSAATSGSQSAASLELASGTAVMAIGGFSGQGGNLSLATFQSYVAKGEIHYYVAGGGMGGGGMGGPGGRGGSTSAITSWVEAHFTAKTIGGQTVYDLTARTS